jgi:hypothetical protein
MSAAWKKRGTTPCTEEDSCSPVVIALRPWVLVRGQSNRASRTHADVIRLLAVGVAGL